MSPNKGNNMQQPLHTPPLFFEVLYTSVQQAQPLNETPNEFIANNVMTVFCYRMLNNMSQLQKKKNHHDRASCENEWHMIACQLSKNVIISADSCELCYLISTKGGVSESQFVRVGANESRIYMYFACTNSHAAYRLTDSYFRWLSVIHL